MIFRIANWIDIELQSKKNSYSFSMPCWRNHIFLLVDWWQFLFFIFRILVMLAFLLWLCASTILIPRVEIGLDQEVSMPRDSFVLKYFQFLKQVRDQDLEICDNTTHQSMMNTELSQQRCFSHFMRNVRHDDPKINIWVFKQVLLTVA